MEVIGLQNFETTNPRLLSFSKDSQITVTEIDNAGLWNGTLDNRSGLFNINMTKPNEPPLYLALISHEFKSNNSNTLSVRKGDVVSVYSDEIEDSPGWAYCQLGNTFGYIPTSFLDKQKIEIEREKTKARITRSMRTSSMCPKMPTVLPCKAVAKFDYIALYGKDISFKKGDEMICLKAIDNRWILVQHQVYGIGYVPLNYIKTENKLYNVVVKKHAMVVYEYEGDTRFHLKADVGDVVFVERIIGTWAIIIVNQQKYVFPAFHLYIFQNELGMKIDEDMGFMLASFQGEGDNELSVEKNEFVVVMFNEENGWSLCKHNDKIGYLPTEFIERIEGGQKYALIIKECECQNENALFDFILDDIGDGDLDSSINVHSGDCWAVIDMKDQTSRLKRGKIEIEINRENIAVKTCRKPNKQKYDEGKKRIDEAMKVIEEQLKLKDEAERKRREELKAQMEAERLKKEEEERERRLKEEEERKLQAALNSTNSKLNENEQAEMKRILEENKQLQNKVNEIEENHKKLVELMNVMKEEIQKTKENAHNLNNDVNLNSSTQNPSLDASKRRTMGFLSKGRRSDTIDNISLDSNDLSAADKRQTNPFFQRRSGTSTTALTNSQPLQTPMNDEIVKEKEKEIENLKKEINELKEMKDKEINELKEMKDKEINELKEMKDKEIEELKKAINESKENNQNEIEALKKEREINQQNEKNEIMKMKQEIEELKKFKNENEQLKKQIEELKRQQQQKPTQPIQMNKSLNTKGDSMRIENEKLRDELEKKENELTKEISDLKRQNETLQHEKESIEIEFKNYKEKQSTYSGSVSEAELMAYEEKVMMILQEKEKKWKKIEDESAKLRQNSTSGQFDGLKRNINKKLSEYRDEITVLKRRVALIEQDAK